LVCDPRRTQHAPPVPQRLSSARPLPTSGHLPSTSKEEDAGQPSSAPIMRIQDLQAASPITQAGITYSGATMPAPTSSIAAGPKRKQATTTALALQMDGPAKRARHTSTKCGKGNGCPGNAGVHKCLGVCQDCKSGSCDGRDSRNRAKHCPNYVSTSAGEPSGPSVA
jgi:hypothetical protein